MSPMQFVTRQNTDAVSQDVCDGLTREQFQQALVYLIQVSWSDILYNMNMYVYRPVVCYMS